MPVFDYAQQNEGWREHRVFNNYAVDALRGHSSGLYEQLVKSLEGLRPAAADAPTPSSLRSAGYEAVGSSSSGLNVSCGGRAVSMAIDPATGALEALNLGGPRLG